MDSVGKLKTWQRQKHSLLLYQMTTPITTDPTRNVNSDIAEWQRKGQASITGFSALLVKRNRRLTDALGEMALIRQKQRIALPRSAR